MSEQTRERGRTTTPPTESRPEPMEGVAVIDIWTFQIEPLPTDTPRERLGATPGTTDPSGLVGFTVEAPDGKIGKVDEATGEAGGSFLIVDTGPGIFGKKVMLPAGVVERIDHERKTVFVSRPKDEIKNAPEYEEQSGHRDDHDFRRRLGDYYRRH